MKRYFYIVCLLSVLSLYISCTKGDSGDENATQEEQLWQKFPADGELKIMSFNVRIWLTVNLDKLAFLEYK